MQKGSTSMIYSKIKQTGSGRQLVHTHTHTHTHKHSNINKNQPGLTELSKLNTNTNEH